MPIAERITRINAEYTSSISRARAMPLTTKRGKINRRRERMIASARRRHQASLAAAGIRAW